MAPPKIGSIALLLVNAAGVVAFLRWASKTWPIFERGGGPVLAHGRTPPLGGWSRPVVRRLRHYQPRMVARGASDSPGGRHAQALACAGAGRRRLGAWIRPRRRASARVGRELPARSTFRPSLMHDGDGQQPTIAALKDSPSLPCSGRGACENEHMIDRCFSAGLGILALATLLVGCNASNGPAECVAAGGACILGSRSCVGTEGSPDCNPEGNPAGAFCCVPCPAGQRPADGGYHVSGCQ